MSASIHYRLTSKADPRLDVCGPSSFIEVIESVFGALPVVLGEDAIQILRGMAAVSKGEKGYNDAIDKIEEFGSIEIYATW